MPWDSRAGGTQGHGPHLSSPLREYGKSTVLLGSVASSSIFLITNSVFSSVHLSFLILPEILNWQCFHVSTQKVCIVFSF